MLLIGGQGALNQHKMGSLQDLPHVGMMSPITKFAATVPHTAGWRTWFRWRSGSATAGRPARPSSRSQVSGTLDGPGPLGTLGVGVPFALAAKFARPDKEVVCLFGDGAFSLTGWDFETMVRFNLPFVGVVGNNSSMNQIRYGQMQKYGAAPARVGNTLGDVHYDQFAKMLGGYGEEVRNPEEIRPALLRVRESGLPSLINVWVDPDAYAPGTMNQTMYK